MHVLFLLCFYYTILIRKILPLMFSKTDFFSALCCKDFSLYQNCCLHLANHLNIDTIWRYSINAKRFEFC